MDLYKRASAVAMLNLCSWLKDNRVRFLFLCIGCYVTVKLWPLTSYCMQAEKTMTPWLLPILFKSDSVSINLMKTILHIGMLLLFCNAPFLFPATPYIVLRSNRSGWWIGECLYIIEAALIYTVFLAVIALGIAMPVISFEPDWGTGLRELMIGNMEQSAEEIRTTYKLYITPGKMGYYLDPLKTQIYTFLTSWASFSVLGLLMYLISLLQRRATIGMIVGGILIFLDPVIYSVNVMRKEKLWIDLLSPVCWTDAGLLKDIHINNFLTIAIVAGMYVLLIVLLCIGIAMVSRRVIIEATGG